MAKKESKLDGFIGRKLYLVERDDLRDVGAITRASDTSVWVGANRYNATEFGSATRHGAGSTWHRTQEYVVSDTDRHVQASRTVEANRVASQQRVACSEIQIRWRSWGVKKITVDNMEQAAALLDYLEAGKLDAILAAYRSVEIRAMLEAETPPEVTP